VGPDGAVYSAGFVTVTANEQQSAVLVGRDRFGQLIGEGGPDPWEIFVEEGPVGGSKDSSADRFLHTRVDNDGNIIAVGTISGSWSGYILGS